MITANQIGEAALKGDLAMLREMLDDDPSLVSSCNEDGWTPLHLAAHNGHANAVRLLLARGADINQKSENAMKNLPLHAAVAGNRTDVVTLLLASASSVNARQHGGWTALHGAAQHGNLEIVRMLVAYGADTKIKNDQGQTAFDIAMENEHKSIAEMLT